MKESILVTGASSVIGQSLLPRLFAQDLSVHVISRRPELAKNDSIANCYLCDLNADTLPEVFFKKIEAAKIQTLVHCAPIWLLPQHITALAELGVQRVIAFSSTSIEGKSSSENTHEQRIVQLLSESEQQLSSTAKLLNVDLTIFRPTMIYGHGKGMNLAFIARFIQKIGFFPVVTKAAGLRRPVHADDLAQAVEFALSEAVTFGKTYALSGSQVMTYQEMVERVFQSLDKPKRILPVPLPIYKLAISVVAKFSNLSMTPSMAERMRDDLNFSSEQAMQDFGYAPGSFLPNGIADILPTLHR